MNRKIVSVFNVEKRACKFTFKDGDSDKSHEYTDIANTIFYSQNKGMSVLKDAVQNGLIAKLGIIRAYVDERNEEEYEDIPEDVIQSGITEEQLAIAINQRLANDPFLSNIKVKELAIDPISSFILSGTLHVERVIKEIKIETVNPEDLILNRDATSLEDARIVSLRLKASAGELIEMGVSKDQIDGLTKHSEIQDYSRLAALGRDLVDHSAQTTSNANEGAAWENTELVVYESYLRTFNATTGEPILLKVVHGKNKDFIIDYEYLDEAFLPVWSWCPFPIAGRFYGLSVADVLAEEQTALTLLKRSVLDSTVSSNTKRLIVKTESLVDVQDILSNKSGGVIRVNSDNPDEALNNIVSPMPAYEIHQGTFGAVDLMDKSAERNSGSPRSGSGIDDQMLKGDKAASLVKYLTFKGEEAVAEMARDLATNVVSPLMYYLVYLHYKVQGIDIDLQELKDSASVAVALTHEERVMQADKLLSIYTQITQAKETTPEIEVLCPPEKRLELLRNAFIELLPESRAYLEDLKDPAVLEKVMSQTKTMSDNAAAETEFAQMIEKRKLDVFQNQTTSNTEIAMINAKLKELEIESKINTSEDKIDIDTYKAFTGRMKLDESMRNQDVAPINSGGDDETN